jgi:hypothetical protein
MRSFSETSLPVQIFSKLGMGSEQPAKLGPVRSQPSVRAAILLFFAISIALAVSVLMLGNWRSANSAGKVQFPPAEWSSQPPQWID